MKELTIAFFTEAGLQRGMGHLVRSYTLYRKALSLGLRAKFYLDSDINYDYKFQNLHYFSFDSFELHERYNIIFIDSYIASIKTYEKIAKNSTLAVYIDDYARLDYPHGLIINFAPDAKKLFFQEEKKKYNYLLGLSYLVLREEILTTQLEKKNQLFIMLGGSDVQGLSQDILTSLDNLQIDKIIVCNNKEIFDTLKHDKNTTLLYQPTDNELITYMAESRLAITTASMSVYELAYLKIPTIIISVAKNQMIGMQQFLNHKLASKFVDIKEDNWQEKIMAATTELLNKKEIIINKDITPYASQKIFQKVFQLCKKS
ncbi:MAG: hypothetical protein COA44_15605 [Arcobacter sp.]|nr:MAG: hypothetical protein COA44_15605 [Arcobacter sp.]